MKYQTHNVDERESNINNKLDNFYEKVLSLLYVLKKWNIKPHKVEERESSLTTWQFLWKSSFSFI